MIVPVSPTTMHRFSETNEAQRNVLFNPVTEGIQFSPPFVVNRMVLFEPTTTPVFSLTNCTKFRTEVVLLCFYSQVFPPSFVRMIAPESVTAVPIFSSLKYTELTIPGAV